MLNTVSQLDLPAGGLLDDPAASAPTANMPCYVVGPENALLPAALERLLAAESLEAAAQRFNPLTLVGPAGSGKTHLVKALARRIGRQCGANAVRYFTAVDFGREVQASRDCGQLASWRRELRSSKLLIIEDLEQLRPRSGIQRELRSAIDALVEAGGMIVATAHHEPTLLRTIDAGVCDRLAGGLIVRIQLPELSTRRMLIEIAAAGRAVATTPERIEALARRSGGPAAQVIGATAELADLPAARRATPETPLKEIVAVTARYFGLRQSDVVGPQRRRTLVYARGMIVHLARKLSGASYAKIGAALGDRDHTTIMHAHGQIKKQISDDPNQLADHEELLRILQAT